MKKKKIFSILSSTAIFLSFYSNAPTASANSQKMNELEQQKQELNQQSDELQGNISDREQQMESLDSERQKLSNDIAEIQSNIDEVLSQIAEQEEEIARLEEEIKKLNEEIEILKDKIDQRNEALAEQARGVQKTGSPSNVIDMILSADSLTELVGKMEVIALLVNNNNTIMEDQIADQKQVEENAAKVEVAKEETNQVKLDLEVNRNNLVAQRMELDNKIQVVSEKFDLTTAERNALQNERQAIVAQTSEIESEMKAEQDRIAAEEAARQRAEAQAREEARQRAEAEANKKQEVQTATSSKAPAPAPSSSSNSNGFARPSGGYVTSEYGYRIHPIRGTRRLHGGIDIGGGGPITAAKSGTVTTATYSNSYGYYVQIDHGGGVSTLYAHMTPGLRVAPGQSVSQGQTIGTMGTTGSSTGVHLHFEVTQNGRKVNPRNFVNF